MPNVWITNRKGVESRVQGSLGVSVMEVIRSAGFDELMAICGGCCSCATCHVYVDPAFLDQLVPMSQGEDELLDSSDRRKPESRLSCQVRLVEDLDGLRVTIAPED